MRGQRKIKVVVKRGLCPLSHLAILPPACRIVGSHRRIPEQLLQSGILYASGWPTFLGHFDSNWGPRQPLSLKVDPLLARKLHQAGALSITEKLPGLQTHLWQPPASGKVEEPLLRHPCATRGQGRAAAEARRRGAQRFRSCGPGGQLLKKAAQSQASSEECFFGTLLGEQKRKVKGKIRCKQL